jgi:hypothetical protein
MTCCGRVSPPPLNLLALPSAFQEQHFINATLHRNRKFNPKNLFLTLSELVCSTNNNGYSIAILNALSKEMSFEDLPSKSALCQYRQQISSEFFKDFFWDLNERSQGKRKTWNGLYVYAVDGIQLTLPRSEDIIKAGFSGRKVSKYRESYMPKMFATMAYDVISGTVKDVRENPTLNEIADALSMVEHFEDNSLTMYDRLYCSRELILKHHDSHNYFLFRLRKNMLKEMRKIMKSKRPRITVVIDNVTVHVIKIKNPKTGEWDYFASNLPLRLVNENQIRTLYRLRWEVENAFRDFTQTIRLEQWHSKFINGIRQELYVALILYNFVKLKILSKFDTAKQCMGDTYQKPNFKLLFGWVTSKLYEIMKGVRGVLKGFEELLDRSLETRTHYSREYEREIKSPHSPFPYNNTRWYGLN